MDRNHPMTSVSIIIPASNEATLIGRCLDSVLASEGALAEAVECIVVANGCHDDTSDQARSRAKRFAQRGWQLQVVDRAEGGKPGALNAGDALARAGLRIYLDADVTLDPALLLQLVETLEGASPRYASGAVQITATGLVSRAYARIWRQVPFMAEAVPGCGLFAVNAAGRARWDSFPEIISDDTYVRLHFTPAERLGVQAGYTWPIAEGLAALVRVRRRQDAGVDEIERLYPDLPDNDDHRPFPAQDKLQLALRDPLGFGIYSLVALVSRLTRHRAKGWSRGR